MDTISRTRIRTFIHSIQWKIVVAYLSITCVAFLLVAVSLVSMVGEYLLTQKVREEQRVTERLAERAALLLVSLDAEALFELARASAEEYSVRVLITDAYGVVLADSESDYNGRRLTLSEVQSVLQGESGANAYYRLMDDQGGDWFSQASGIAGDGQMLGLCAAPVVVQGQVQGALVFISPSDEVYESLRQIQRQMTIYLVLVALAVLLMSLFASRLFTRPINELRLGIQRMTQGDLSSRVAVRGRNEFTELAEAFNMMCERLESLDSSRNQFVSNASHELKTPLSTMKILLETLLYQEDYDITMQKEFLGDINKEIDRLNSIVNDLLTLVHFDGSKMHMRATKLQLDELLRATIRRIEPLARDRQIELALRIVDPVETMADQMKLEQVFYNLVDNAIKYTPPGGMVALELSRTGRKAVITVTDNGVGIPKSDLRHIFDRFYRVDRARARETGGTGLGLSIVKQIVMLHEGTVSVQSEEDVGSTFTVELPIVNL